VRPIGCVPLGEVQEEDEDDDEKDEETACDVGSMMTPQGTEEISKVEAECFMFWSGRLGLL